MTMKAILVEQFTTFCLAINLNVVLTILFLYGIVPNLGLDKGLSVRNKIFSGE